MLLKSLLFAGYAVVLSLMFATLSVDAKVWVLMLYWLLSFGTQIFWRGYANNDK